LAEYNFEIIFIDDGSTDNSLVFLKEKAKENKNIYVGKEIARRSIIALRRTNSPFDPKVASLISLALQFYNKV